MSYEATCTRISAIEKHPNADRLQLATVCGMQVIVGLGSKVGDLGLYFPPGGLLSVEFATTHKLLKSCGGYLSDTKPRVEAMKLRQIQSYGLFIPVEGFYKEGDLVGEPICRKYLSERQRQQQVTGRRPQRETIGLPKHYDTSQLWNVIGHIKPGTAFEVTEKLHGTSGRSGWMPKKRARAWWGRLRDWLSREKHIYVCGSRNVEFTPGYEPGCRAEVHEALRPYVRRGEVWFYDIVGYDGTKKIQPDLADPDTKQKHDYSYGVPPGRWVAAVYRITGADGKDLVPHAVRDRVSVVEDPMVTTVLCLQNGWFTTPQNVMKSASKYANQPSLYAAGGHELAAEGVVLVFYDETTVHAVAKLKSFKFCQMEGIAYGGGDYLDPEEAA